MNSKLFRELILMQLPNLTEDEARVLLQETLLQVEAESNCETGEIIHQRALLMLGLGYKTDAIKLLRSSESKLINDRNYEECRALCYAIEIMLDPPRIEEIKKSYDPELLSGLEEYKNKLRIEQLEWSQKHGEKKP